MYSVPMTLLVPETPQERALVGDLYVRYGSRLLEGGDQERGGSDPGAPTAEAPASEVYAGDGGLEKLRQFVTEVQAPNARRALRAMADHTLEGGSPPDSDQIRTRLGMELDTVNRLGGMLTSVGHAMNRTGLPRPYFERWSSDRERQTYVMRRGVAKNLQVLLDDDGSLN